MISNFLGVLNFNRLFLKLNQFICRNYTKCDILVPSILIVMLNTNCKPQYGVTDTNVNPTLFFIHCKK